MLVPNRAFLGGLPWGWIGAVRRRGPKRAARHCTHRGFLFLRFARFLA